MSKDLTHRKVYKTSLAARPRHQAQEAAARLTSQESEEGIAEAIQHVKENLPHTIAYESPYQLQLLGDPIDVENKLKGMGWRAVIHHGPRAGSRGVSNMYDHWGHEGVTLTHSYTRAPLFTDANKEESKSVLSFHQTGTGSGY